MRKGFTLIEILVVILIVSVIAAIAVPAIFAARASARNLSCTNNLKQISLGLINYASNHGAFPGYYRTYSPLAQILPYIEQSAVYNSINFSVENGPFPSPVGLVNIPTFQCPEDAGDFPLGMTNYALNCGVGNKITAPFSFGQNIGFLEYKNVTDGMSQTAFGAEWLKGSPTTKDEKRTIYRAQFHPIITGGFEDFCAACETLDQASVSHLIKGSSWLTAGFGMTLYNHALPPDSHSCSNGTLLQEGAWSASSNHGGKTNVFFGDGHVSSYRHEIDKATWRSLGTMNGSEIIRN